MTTDPGPVETQRVVILGGGMAALVTAFELTRTPELRQRHEITVLQPGHRLGGKGASGVNLHNAHRIEEHGLHVIFGFYENVFRVMRECYEELAREPGKPLRTWREAFKPEHLLVLSESHPDSGFMPFLFPPNDEVPGDGVELNDPSRYVARVLKWVRTLSRDTDKRLTQNTRPSEPKKAPKARRGRTLRRVLNRSVLRRNDDGALAAAGMLRVAAGLARRSQRRAGSRPRSGLEHSNSRTLLDFALTIVRGILVDGLVTSPPRWFDVDDEDFRAWLRRHGARDTTVQSPLVDALYYAVFSEYAPLGAGTMLHATLRIFLTYKGSVLYRMQAGMGDVIFAPLYQVLRRRGVRFEFFQSVRALELSGDCRQVARIVVDRQATVQSGTYEPLVDVHALPCWPAKPDYSQLVEGEAIRDGDHDLGNWWTAWRAVGDEVLEAGRDFDVVVLAISLGALPDVCQELMEDPHNPKFRAMVDNVRTTNTQAAQLWFDRDLPELGWTGSPPQQRTPIVVSFREPFPTWADMSYLLQRETWPANHRPQQLSYVCGAMEDDEPVPPRDDLEYPARQRARVRSHLLSWLRDDAHVLLPGAGDDGDFAWERLVDTSSSEGAPRLAGQHYCATIHPSDRYVLSVPGSVRFRLRADESGYENLILAGDWTKTALSFGCLEAATMSGFAAARAVDCTCRRAYGDWLPERVPIVAPAATAAPGPYETAL